MGKVVVPILAVALVGVLAWFLMRPPAVDQTPRAAPGSAGLVRPEGVATEGAAAAATVAAPPRVVVGGLANRRPLPALAGDAPAEEVPADQAGPAPMPESTVLEVQDTVRAYFGNLPKSGKMPAKVTLEEVLPPRVIEQLGARADAPLVMLGNRNIDDRQAYVEILELTGQYQQMMGVSWREPDGTERRHYVKLVVPEEAQ